MSRDWLDFMAAIVDRKEETGEFSMVSHSEAKSNS